MDHLDIYYINLDQSKKRREKMEQKLLGFFDPSEFQRFVAMRGDERQTQISKSELGCFLSHQSILENAAHDKYILVLEDDVLLANEFKSHLKKIIEKLKEKPFDWDILFLAQMTDIGNLQATYQLLKIAATLKEPTKSGRIFRFIDAKSFYASSTSAYIVNPLSRPKLKAILQDQAKKNIRKR